MAHEHNETKVLQLRTDAPNPVLELGGYEPKTNYWPMVISLANAMIVDRAWKERDVKDMVSTANLMFDFGMFTGEHEAHEWAEFVMAINHILWLLHDVYTKEPDEHEYLRDVCEVLDNLYYEWHDKALSVLKGDALGEYLQITD